MTQRAETDPQKIAARLAQTKRARQNQRPMSREELAAQISAHNLLPPPSREKPPVKSDF